MAYIWLGLLLVEEITFLVWSIFTKSTHKYEKGICNISIALLFLLSVLTGLTQWGFQYISFGIFLLVKVVFSVVTLIKKKEGTYKTKKAVFHMINNVTTVLVVLVSAFVFPSYKPIENMGAFEVKKTTITWVDESRLETYLDDGSYRSLSTEFYYPDDASQTYPLVVFSHGAFGYSGSNYSTFMTLASHGYVVASVGHTFQAFFSKDDAGNVAIVDQDFLNQAIVINGATNTENDQGIYETTSVWMDLRTSDLNFVINTIIEKSNDATTSDLFDLVDVTQIGLFGHSLGGAASAEMGRIRDDVDAVIVLDGTMLGEEIGFEDGHVTLNNTAYPVPLLNVYAQDHYDNAKMFVGDNYNNFVATANAVDAYEAVFMKAGHLNFTDLPLFSPLLSQLLGVGLVDERYCIEQMNELVLNYFDYFLKDAATLNIKTEY